MTRSFDEAFLVFPTGNMSYRSDFLGNQCQARECRASAAAQDGRASSHYVSVAARWCPWDCWRCGKPEDPSDPLRNHEMTVGSPVEKGDIY